MSLWTSIKGQIVNAVKGQLPAAATASMRTYVYIFAVLLIYVANRNCIERDLRAIYELNAEIKDLRYESISVSAELMNMSKQSEVLRRVKMEGLQLKELTEPPRIIEK